MNSKQFLKEGFLEDAQEAHMDHEVQMARVDCYYAAEHAIVLHKLLRNISEEQGLEGWVASKITLANDYLKSVREHLEYQMMNADADEGDFLPLAEGISPTKKKVSEDITDGDNSIQEFERGPWYVILRGQPVTENGEPKRFNWLNGAKTYFRSMLDDQPELAREIKSEYDKADDKKTVIYYTKKLPTTSSSNTQPDIGQQVSEAGNKPGLWANIRAKRERIKRGSGERMRKPGSKGAPSDTDLKSIRAASNESTELEESLADEFGEFAKKFGQQRGITIKPRDPKPRSPFPGPENKGAELPLDRETLEARLKELQSRFDPAYEYSDDHAFWSEQNEIAKEIRSIKRALSQQGVAEDLLDRFKKKLQQPEDPSYKKGWELCNKDPSADPQFLFRKFGVGLDQNQFIKGFNDNAKSRGMKLRGDVGSNELTHGDIKYKEFKRDRGVAEDAGDDLVYISIDRVEAFENWMDSEGLETNVPKTDEGTYVVYDYSNADYRSKMYASDWNEKKGVAEALDPDTQRLEQEVRDALAKGDDYTAKSLVKMAHTAADRNYLRKIIRQEMYGTGPGQGGVAEGSFSSDPADDWEPVSEIKTTTGRILASIIRSTKDGKYAYYDELRPGDIETGFSSPQEARQAFLDIYNDRRKKGVTETKVDNYKDMGTTKDTTHFVKNITTGKIVSPHRSKQDAEDALVANMRDSKDEFKIVRARKESVEKDSGNAVEALIQVYNNRDQKIIKTKVFASEAEANRWADRNNAVILKLKDVPKKSTLDETSAGSVATVVNPTPKNRAKVGTLFGGTYKQTYTRGKK